MTSRVIRFIATADGAAPPAPGIESVVLDTSWTPLPGARPDVRPLRPILVEVLRELDPVAESLALLDRWAAASDVVDRLEVDGFSWWYRRRLVYWRGLHDRLIWRGVLAALAREGPVAGLELTTDQPELVDVARLAAADAGWAFSTPPPPPARVAPPRRRLPWPLDPILWRLGLHPAQRAAERDPRVAARRSAAMLDRVGSLARVSGGLLVLTAPATHQVVARDGASGSRDPFLGSVVDALRGSSLEPILLEVGTDAADDRTWEGLRAPGRERVLPGSVIGRAYATADDDAEAEVARRRVEARLAEPFARLEVDGLDLGSWIVDGLRRYAAGGLASELRQARRIGRFLDRLRPAAMLMVNEYSRPEWLIAGARAGVPVVAVQHGIIHPSHPGYVLPSRDGLPLASRTHLFGDYEARLLTGSSVYRPDEIVVSGAPRLDLVPDVGSGTTARDALRATLGVTAGDRLVVFSSTSSAAVRATVIAAAFDTILDRPWPGVHLVVKLHPGEDDGAFYPLLIEGLARGRGFAPPPVTVVKAIDLYELLRASDAHLGVYSTVLTDAVAAGAPNLIITSLRGTDLLGYVAAGVAEPVACGADVMRVLDEPADTALPVARAAFLADHFAPGPSSRRIADDLLARYARPEGGAVVR
jgi:hypothetical protein